MSTATELKGRADTLLVYWSKAAKLQIPTDLTNLILRFYMRYVTLFDQTTKSANIILKDNNHFATVIRESCNGEVTTIDPFIGGISNTIQYRFNLRWNSFGYMFGLVSSKRQLLNAIHSNFVVTINNKQIRKDWNIPIKKKIKYYKN